MNGTGSAANNPQPVLLSHYDPAVKEMSRAYKLAVEQGAPQAVADSIYTALNLVEQRENFAHMSTTKESAECKNILDVTLTTDWKQLKADNKTLWKLTPTMMTGPLEGQFLKSLVSIHRAKRVLDIGMFTGYSALSMAEALPADGEVVTVDVDPFLEGLTGDLLNKSPHGKKIKIKIGKGIEVMKELAQNNEQFDIIFLDAEKSEYPDYMTIAFDQNLLASGGSVIVDNAFLHGAGYMGGENPSKRFAAAVAARKDLHRVLVPLRDGIAILRRLSDVEGVAA